MIDSEKTYNAIADLLVALGAHEGEHTQDTPRRVTEAWAEALAGYEEDPREHLRCQLTAPDKPGLIMVSGIRLVSTCALHLLPIAGTATIGYRPHPGDPVTGLSKLVRVVDGYAQRLQVQEHLGYQVANAMQEVLSPIGAGCLITAAHSCMTLRGVKDPHSVTTTHSLTGAWVPGHPDVVALLDEHGRNIP